MPLILGTNSIKDTGFDVANSLRFNRGSSDNLTRSTGTATNNDKATVSFWLKRSGSSSQGIIAEDTNGSNKFAFILNSNQKIELFQETSGSTDFSVITTRVFRDNSAWYHIVIAYDSSQGTASNRIKVYVNGVQETAFDTGTYPSSNVDFRFNKNSITQQIGSYENTAFMEGYLSEFVFIDGSQLAADQFGEFDSDSGIWKPINVSGLTFGNNGFYLDFENSGSLGADVSGNGNNFTVNNLTSIDQSSDSCTNNFCTLNPLVPTSSATFSEGNLKLVGSSSSAFNNRSQGTFGVQSGKWYFEVEFDSISATSPTIGIGRSDRSASDNPTGSNAGDVCIRADNEKYDEGSSSASYFSSSISAGDIIGVALDMDNGKVWFSKNGTFVGTVDTSGQASDFTVGNGITITPTVRPTDGTLICNFGNSPVAISSGNADGNGYGNFEYAVPSGYYSLNTKNLSEFG